MKRLLTLLITLLLLGLAACKQYSYVAPGECQLIGTKDKLWIVFQVRQMVASTWHTYDAPSQYSKHEYGILATIDHTGKTSISKILVPDNLSLYINLSHIFYYNDNVYLYGRVSDKWGYGLPGYHLFILEEGALKESSIEDIVVHNILLKEVHSAQKETKQLSCTSGAIVVQEYYSLYYRREFMWGDQNVELSLKYNDSEKYFEYIVKVSPLLKEPLIIHEDYSITEI